MRGNKLLTTDITGCLVNGAARGDLSAEKVYVKLVRMTCAQPGGRFAVWVVIGSVFAYLLPSAGPCFDPVFTGGASGFQPLLDRPAQAPAVIRQTINIGREPCRERVCQYV